MKKLRLLLSLIAIFSMLGGAFLSSAQASSEKMPNLQTPPAKYVVFESHMRGG